MLGHDQGQAQTPGADPGKHLGLEVVCVEQPRLLPQVRQQFLQAVAVVARHAGLGETLQQRVGGIDEHHPMLPRGAQAMIQQHALGTVETAAVDQVHDRLRGHAQVAHCLAQCQAQRQVQRGYGLTWGCSTALSTISTGRPR